MERKIRVYVSSFEISTLDYVDKDSMGHPCVTSHHSENIYSEFRYLPEGSLDGHLTADQMKAVNVVSEFCKENGLTCEVVDIANVNLISKMKLMFKGIKAPTISFEGKKIEGTPTKQDLKTLIS